jgi:KDO2-lipid IV(A) lauroyltransferase
MAIVYYIFTALVWLLSKLPLSVLYIKSDVLAFILYRIAGYRKKVVRENLKNAFPDKTPAERKSIEKQYYRNLADIIIEVIKWRSISREELLKRFRFENMELFHDAFKRGQGIIIAIGHCGNWEWMGTTLGLISDKKGYAVVKPLSDPRFNKYMMKLRHRLNPDSTIPFKETFRRMLVTKKKELTFNVFAADQTPTRDEINYWTDFMNQDTGFFLGIEKIARSLDFTVLFVDIVREKRGYYKGVMSLISDAPSETAEYEITEGYVKSLETAIRNNPSNWLWSHRRWKHQRNSE